MKNRGGKKSYYDVLLCGDKEWLKYVGVTLTSILENAPDDDYVFHIFYDDIEQEDINKFRATAEKYHADIFLYRIHTQAIYGLRVGKNSRITIGTYFRIIAYGFLSESGIKKILYLDGDILVKKSLRDFFGADMGGKIALVVADTEEEKLAKLQSLKRYFNAGVMLVNLIAWKEKLCTPKALQMASGNIYPYKDQDILNILLDQKAIFLQSKYNFQYGLSAAIEEERVLPKEVVIAHFVGSSKPWHSWTQEAEIVREYNQIKDKSFWRDNQLVTPDECRGIRYKLWHKQARAAKKSKKYLEMLMYYWKYSVSKIAFAFKR